MFSHTSDCTRPVAVARSDFKLHGSICVPCPCSAAMALKNLLLVVDLVAVSADYLDFFYAPLRSALRRDTCSNIHKCPQQAAGDWRYLEMMHLQLADSSRKNWRFLHSETRNYILRKCLDPPTPKQLSYRGGWKYRLCVWLPKPPVAAKAPKASKRFLQAEEPAEPEPVDMAKLNAEFHTAPWHRGNPVIAERPASQCHQLRRVHGGKAPEPGCLYMQTS